MQLFSRIALLVVFAAAGAGAAVYIANNGPLPGVLAKTASSTAVSAEPPATTPPVDAEEPMKSPHGKLVSNPDTLVPPAVAAKRADSFPLPPEINPVAPLTHQPPATLPADLLADARKSQDAVAEKMKQLESKLDLMREDARRREIADLERRISDNQREAQAVRRLTEERWAQLRGPAPMAAPRPIQPLPQPQQPAPAAVGPPAPAPPIEPPTVAQNSNGGLSIQIKDGDLRKVLEDLGRHSGLNLLISDKVTGTVSASLTNVSLEDAMEAVLHSTGYEARTLNGFTYIGSPQELNAMETSRERIATRVYRPDYVTANELNTLITPMLTKSIGTSTVTSAAENGIPASNTETGGDNYAGNEVVLVRDYPSVLMQIDEVVNNVDVRPRQVVIEAVILSVELNDSCELGIDFELLTGSDNARLVTGAPLANLAQLQITPGQLSFGILDGDLGALVQALEQIGDTKVVAQPKLTCLNKQRAEILIGDQKGFVSTTQTETATTQTVEFLDVGTQLRIRPFISSDGLIRLEVHPELSTGEVRLVGNFALPEKSTTQVTTNVMCADGATIVLGGLIREDTSNNKSQVPGLGSIPFFGPLFQKQNEEVERSEIVVLITPRIVPDPAASAQCAFSKQEYTRRQADNDMNNMHVLHHAKYSRRYFRLAQAAYTARNYHAARNYVNISLQFWNENPESQQLSYLLQQRQTHPGAQVIHEAPVIEVPANTGQAVFDALQQGEEEIGLPPVQQPEVTPYYQQHPVVPAQ